MKWSNCLRTSDFLSANIGFRLSWKHNGTNLLQKRQTAVLPLTAEQHAATRHSVDSRLLSSGKTRSLALTIFIAVALSTYTRSQELNPASLCQPVLTSGRHPCRKAVSEGASEAARKPAGNSRKATDFTKSKGVRIY